MAFNRSILQVKIANAFNLNWGSHVNRAQNQLVTIFGGSGFIGRHIVQKLAHQGHRIRVAVRRPDLAGHLQPLGNVGQIMAVQANVRYPASLESACQNADIVINLTGVLASHGSQSFEAVHEFGAQAVARAAKKTGAQQFIHMSAIGADENSPSAYGRSKAIGEKNTKTEFPAATIIRPSIVFGPEDDFFNKFAEMARFSPVLPLIGGGTTRFRPVFVGDIAEAVATIINNTDHMGKTFELGGPEVLSFRQLLEFILKTVDRKRILLPIPWFAAKILGSVLGILPNAPLTRDQVLMLQSDNLISDLARKENRTLEGLAIDPETIAAQVPAYLYRYKKFGQFTESGNSTI